MTSTEFMSAINAELAAWGTANFPTMPIIYENGPTPDEDKIGPIWLDTEIRWYGGNIASVGSTPRTRDTGAISLRCYFRESEGTAQPNAVIESLTTLFAVRRIGSAILAARQRTVPTHLRGWYCTGILVPFTLG